MRLTALAFLLLLLAPATRADTFHVNFDSDAVGARLTPFRSASSNFVTFSNPSGALLVRDESPGGRVLSADGPGEIVMDFAQESDRIVLTWGHDLGPLLAGEAVLTLTLRGQFVAEARAAADSDLLSNQGISFQGAGFDRAVLRVVTAGGLGAGESVIFLQVLTDFRNPAPEPASLLLLGTGLAAVAGLGRRRWYNREP